jgi:hypothetical protein
VISGFPTISGVSNPQSIDLFSDPGVWTVILSPGLYFVAGVEQETRLFERAHSGSRDGLALKRTQLFIRLCHGSSRARGKITGGSHGTGCFPRLPSHHWLCWPGRRHQGYGSHHDAGRPVHWVWQSPSLGQSRSSLVHRFRSARGHRDGGADWTAEATDRLTACVKRPSLPVSCSPQECECRTPCFDWLALIEMWAAR